MSSVRVLWRGPRILFLRKSTKARRALFSIFTRARVPVELTGGKFSDGILFNCKINRGSRRGLTPLDIDFAGVSGRHLCVGTFARRSGVGRFPARRINKSVFFQTFVLETSSMLRGD